MAIESKPNKYGSSMINSFSAALLQALHSLDKKGCFTRKAARKLLRYRNNISEELRQDIGLEPDKYLGLFSLLPSSAQSATVQAIANEDKWRMIGHEIGLWHISIARFFRRISLRFTKYRFFRSAKVLDIISIVFQNGQAHILFKIYKLFSYLRGRLLFKPTLGSILYISGIEPRNFAICYAQNIPQLPKYRGFWHDALRKNTYGLIIGIDFIPNHDGCWFIESNLNFGMSSTRSALYDRDPLVENMVKFVIEHEYKHLIFVNNMWTRMNKEMARQLKEMTFAYELKLTIVEDIYLPKSSYHQSYGIPLINSNNTLIIRTKNFRTSLDQIFQNKRASYRALKGYQKQFPDQEIFIPPTNSKPVIDNVSQDDPFPNLVYKLPERDEGKGLIFIKASSPEHAYMLLAEAIRMFPNRGFVNKLYSFVEDRNGIFQSFIRSPLLEGRKLYKVRAHVLITPTGIKYLSAHRVISKYEVPEYLPFGIVHDVKPYLVNLASSITYEMVLPEEERAIEKAALSVAEGLVWAVEYGFQTAS